MEAVVSFRSLVLQQQRDAIGISQHLNRRKTAGLEDIKGMCMWKSQYSSIMNLELASVHTDLTVVWLILKQRYVTSRQINCSFYNTN